MVKVSVIMPVYNAEKFLDEAVSGILNQTLTDLELICVDDGSTDNSLKILEDYASKDSRVQVYHQENGGGGAARNRALTYTTGEYLYCMDADDLIEPFALEECYELATQKDVDFIMFQAKNYNMEKNTYNNIKIFEMDNIADKVGESVFSYRDLGDLLFDTSSTPWSKFYNLDFVKRTGAQFAEGLIFHDNIFWWDILLNGERIYFYRKFLYIRRNHSESSTRAGDRRYFDAITISNMIWDIFIRHNQFDNYKKGLGMRKFDKVKHWYDRIRDDLKEEYFQAMKRDYEKIAQDRQFVDGFVPSISKKSKKIFFSTLKARNHEEFDELMKSKKSSKQKEKPNKFKRILKRILK